MRIIYIFFLSLLPAVLLAQPNVNLCIENTGSALEVKIQPDAAFSGFVANLQFTIQADDPTVTFGLPTGIQAYIPMAKAGSETAFAGNTYQKFAGFGTLPLSSFGSAWATAEVITLFSILPSDLTANFSIAVDTWATDNNGEYYIELDALDKTGSVSVCSSTLPVEGLALSAKAMALNVVQLNWQSLSESGSDYYQVEKSKDHGAFEVLARVEAVGYSQQPSFYQFQDRSEMGLYNQYRIRQVDQNAAFVHSNIQTISWDQDLVGSLFPNPCGERCYLKLRLLKPAQLELKVYDSLGQMVLRDKRSAQQGNQNIALETNKLAAGVYTLILLIDGKRQSSQRLIVL
ncbi:MAG: T9SS type A sorting domain-containing protein [Bacteroidota bacterium]